MIKSFFSNNSIEPTKARVAIYRILNDSVEPIDTNTIIEKLHDELIDVNRVTVFRVLNFYLKKGLIHKLEFSEGKSRYELSSLPHHHHLICNKCGLIEDIEIQENNFIAEVQKKSKFKVDHHHLEFFGMCVNCQ